MRVVVNDRDYDLKELGLDKYEFLQKLDEMKDPQVISFLTDAPIEDIKKAPFGEVKFVSSMVKKQAFDMFEDTPLELTYTHKGKNYGLIVPSKISFEEWINSEVFMAKDKVDLPLMAAHLYKPLKNDKQGHERELIDYSLEECEERAKNEFQDFPIRVFNSALFFFTTFVMEYTKNILLSSEMKQTDKKQETNPLNQENPNN